MRWMWLVGLAGVCACGGDASGSPAAPLPAGPSMPTPAVPPPSSSPPSSGDDDGGSGPVDVDENLGSYLWVASSPNGYVVKIDTRSATEVARYATGEEGTDPSRTTVDLSGDVAVVNRGATGVVKIAGSLDACRDADDDGVITTSQGPEDLLPWGLDECVLWTSDIRARGGSGARGTSWEPVAEGARLWVGWLDVATRVPVVERLDGATGEALERVEIPLTTFESPNYGPYGGAADADGGFWFVMLGGSLWHIDPETLQPEEFFPPDEAVLYGLTLAPDGTPWMGGVDGSAWRWLEGRFDGFGTAPTTMVLRGVGTDADGNAWVAQNEPCGLLGVEVATGAVRTVALPECVEPVGVSIDADGFVWVVDRGASRAYQVDPLSEQVVAQVPVDRPYTYSDMTGIALRNQVVTVG